MILIKVESTETRKIEGKNQAGREYSFQTQEAYAFTVDRKTGQPHKYPEKIEITLEKDQPAYSVGTYTLGETSLYVDRNRRLSLSPRLEKTASKPAA